jgi:periplasmic divalent cation tolerance protein
MHEAKNIANALVNKGLAACVNIHPITSVYKWKENVEEEREVELSIKTTSEMLENVKKTIISMHSYELPALLWWSVDVEDKYAHWIIECMKTE